MYVGVFENGKDTAEARFQEGWYLFLVGSVF